MNRRESRFMNKVLKDIPTMIKKDVLAFFDTDYEIVYIGNGYIGLQYHEDKVGIAFLYGANKISTHKEIVKFLRGKVLYYSFKDYDRYANHSVQINDNLFMLKV